MFWKRCRNERTVAKQHFAARDCFIIKIRKRDEIFPVADASLYQQKKENVSEKYDYFLNGKVKKYILRIKEVVVH